jgi:hypothetical protein
MFLYRLYIWRSQPALLAQQAQQEHVKEASCSTEGTSNARDVLSATMHGSTCSYSVHMGPVPAGNPACHLSTQSLFTGVKASSLPSRQLKTSGVSL